MIENMKERSVSETRTRSSIRRIVRPEEKCDNWIFDPSEDHNSALNKMLSPHKRMIVRASAHGRKKRQRNTSMPIIQGVGHRVSEEDLREASENWSKNIARYCVSGESLMGSRRESLADINENSGLQAAFEKAVQRELELSHAMSRMQMQLEEKNVMFQQAVDFGERLQQELDDVSKELSYQISKNNKLEGESNVLRERISILDTTVSELRLLGFEAQRAYKEASRRNTVVKAELDKQKELSREIQDDYVAERINENDRKVGADETITRLRSEVTKERLGRLEAEETVTKLRNQQEEASKQLHGASSRIQTLEEELVQKVASYNEVLMGLSAEKARLEAENSGLIEAYYDKDAQLLEAAERLERAGLSIAEDYPAVASPSIGEYENLETTIILAAPGQASDSEKDWSVPASLMCSEVDFRDREIRSRLEKKPPTPIADVIREYLHITATAVLLHFPDVNTVPSDVLIKKAENLNFSCYYDIMMQHMLSIREERLRKAEEEAVSQNVDQATEKSTWLSRFFRLKEKRTKKLSRKEGDRLGKASGS